MGSFASYTLWIGATDHAKEGEWKWIDNSLANPEDLNWNQNQPDNYNGRQHCATLLKSSFLLVDDYCSSRYFGLCERSICVETK